MSRIAAPAVPAAPAVQTVDVTKYYPGRAPPALEQITIEIPAGQFAAVVGASGSGKSSLLNLVGALDSPSSGTVALFGGMLRDRSDDDLTAVRRHLVGFVFQQFHLIPTLSALENVITPMIADRRLRRRGERARDALAAVGLGGKERQLPGQLSGGEQQRVAIARALVMGPRLLLADEPTGNLDARTGAAIMALLAAKRREHGMTLLIATHDLELALSADRVIGLVDGRVSTDLRVGTETTVESLMTRLGGSQRRP